MGRLFAPRGYAKSPQHAAANVLARAERQTYSSRAIGRDATAVGAGGFGIVIDVSVDLRPLANALRYIGPGSERERHTVIARALNRGIEHFRTAAHEKLKQLTKIRRPSRLKKGVRLIRAHSGRMAATYVITDRNIRITKAYFGATYSNHGRAGAAARWGRGGSPSGATWTSWDGTRTGKSTFMIKGKSPVFIRLGKPKRFPITPVWGPNPAELVRLHQGQFMVIMAAGARRYLDQAITRSYSEAVLRAKARYGL